MGLLGGVGKALGGLFGGDFASRAARAQAFLNGDYGGAARITGMMQDNALQQAKYRQEAEQLRAVHAQIDQDPSLSPQDKVYAKANPKAYIDNYMSRFKQVEMGAAGGSIGNRNAAGGMDWQQGPSRHQYQGSVFDVGPSQMGQQATVTPQHEGTMYVTPQPGTEAFPVNSFSGARIGGAPTVSAGLPQPRSAAERDALPPGTEYLAPDGRRMRKGGAAPLNGPGGFRRPY